MSKLQDGGSSQGWVEKVNNIPVKDFALSMRRCEDPVECKDGVLRFRNLLRVRQVYRCIGLVGLNTKLPLLLGLLVILGAKPAKNLYGWCDSGHPWGVLVEERKMEGRPIMGRETGRLKLRH